MNQEKRSTRDIVISVEQQIDDLKEQFNNHLTHHWGITVIALSAGFIGSVNLLVGLILIFMSK